MGTSVLWQDWLSLCLSCGMAGCAGVVAWKAFWKGMEWQTSYCVCVAGVSIFVLDTLYLLGVCDLSMYSTLRRFITRPLIVVGLCGALYWHTHHPLLGKR
jgi:hypothetical protein